MHPVHDLCLSQWLIQDDNISCPVCRTSYELLPLDEKPDTEELPATEQPIAHIAANSIADNLSMPSEDHVNNSNKDGNNAEEVTVENGHKTQSNGSRSVEPQSDNQSNEISNALALQTSNVGTR